MLGVGTDSTWQLTGMLVEQTNCAVPKMYRADIKGKLNNYFFKEKSVFRSILSWN